MPASHIASQSRAIVASGATTIEEEQEAPSEICYLVQERKTLKQARLIDLGCLNGLVTGIGSCLTLFTLSKYVSTVKLG